MEKIVQEKSEKLNRIVCVRMSVGDFNALLEISQRNQSKVSKVIRSVISNVIDLVQKK